MWNLAVPWWELILRGGIVYLFLLVLLRVTGKRQVGQLAPFELVLLLVLSNAVQNSMNAGENSLASPPAAHPSRESARHARRRIASTAVTIGTRPPRFGRAEEEESWPVERVHAVGKRLLRAFAGLGANRHRGGRYRHFQKRR